MDSFSAIDRFISEVGAAQTLEAVFAALRRETQALGFPWCTYELEWPREGVGQNLFSTTYPDEFIARYISERYASNDLVCRYAGQKIRPFSFDEVVRNRHITEAQKRVRDEARDFKLISGGCVPIHGPGDMRAYVAVASDRPAEEFEPYFARCRHQLHLVGIYIHERVIALHPDARAKRRGNLTPREIEVMSWTARGRTVSQIAEILNLSEHTVRDHVENACVKLSVSNKTHATAVALVEGLIEI